MNKICLIGLGRLGSHLYFSMKKTGEYDISYIVKNSKTKIKSAEVNKSQIIFICTGDTGISKIVNELKKKEYILNRKYIYHTSGAFDSDLLKPLEAKGAYTGSFHPVQTFESRVTSRSKRFHNIYIAIEGNLRPLKKAKEIIHTISAKPLLLTKEAKLLHHINCVIASNYLVSFIYQIELLSQLISDTYISKKGKLIGFKKTNFFGIYKPLIEQTLRNIESKGTSGSLTGPIARNDINTVIAHVKTIRNKIPFMLPFYTLMGTEAVKLALKKKSIKKPDAEILLKELNKTGFTKEKKKRIN